MGLAFASSALLIASKLIESKQLQQKALITQLLYSNLNENAKILSKQLRASVDFEYLTIADTNNNVLYRYIKDPKQRPTLSYVLKYFDLYTPVQRVKASQSKLVLEFQSSFSQILTPLTVIVVAALFAPIMMLLLIYMLAEYVQDKRLEKIIRLLELKLVQDEKLELPKGVNKLDQFVPLINKLEKKYNNKPVSSNTSKIDKVTGLPNYQEFATAFNKAKFSGHLVLIRANNLLSHDQEQLEKQQQLIAKAIWQTFSFAEDSHIYKLNNADFALLIFDQNIDLSRLIDNTSAALAQLVQTEPFVINITTAYSKFEPSAELDQLLTDIESKLR